MEQIEISGVGDFSGGRVKVRPLVLLHGGPMDGRAWVHQLDGLSSEFTVVAWDVPGCGGSSDPPQHFRTRDYAECLAAFIDALGLERPHVLGLSFGSGLALELYRWHPDIPKTLILASAYAGWAGSLPARSSRIASSRCCGCSIRLRIGSRPSGFRPCSLARRAREHMRVFRPTANNMPVFPLVRALVPPAGTERKGRKPSGAFVHVDATYTLEA